MDDAKQLMPVPSRQASSTPNDLPLMCRGKSCSSRVSKRFARRQARAQLLDDLPPTIREHATSEGVRCAFKEGIVEDAGTGARGKVPGDLHHPRRPRGADRVARGRVGRIGRAGRDLLRHRRRLRRREAQPHLEIFRKKGVRLLILRPCRRTGRVGATSSEASRCARSPWATRSRSTAANLKKGPKARRGVQRSRGADPDALKIAPARCALPTA